MSSDEIFSSTGGQGAEERQDGRWYCNAQPSDDPERLAEEFESLVTQGQCLGAHISRVVRRGIVSHEVIAKTRSSSLAMDTEAILPLEEFGHRGYLQYLGRNQSHRNSTPCYDLIAQATLDNNSREQREPSFYTSRLGQDNSRIQVRLDEEAATQLEDLWVPIFGWEPDQIRSFADALQKQQNSSGELPSFWFAAIYSGSLLVSAAMAERLTIEGLGGPVDLIESTEWCTQPNHAEQANGQPSYRNKGYLTAALVALNAQILQSFAGSDSQPLIYAECNFTSRSDRAGYGAGFRIPPRSLARQILPANVTVNDGILPKGLRDFNFMYLPTAYINANYGPDQLDKILSVAH